MTRTDKAEFAKLVGKVGIACSKQITTETLEVYFEALEDLLLAQVKYGARHHLKTWDKPGCLPTPAQFRSAAQDTRQLRRDSTHPRSGEGRNGDSAGRRRH